MFHNKIALFYETKSIYVTKLYNQISLYLYSLIDAKTKNKNIKLKQKK